MTVAPSKTSSPSPTNKQEPQIVIVGGGFGGLYTALYLQKYRRLKSCAITLIEPRGQFLFTPMLYEVLTDELLLWEVAPSYESLLAGTNIQWQQDWVEHIELSQQQVWLRHGESLTYDYLVVATGAKTRKLPIPGLGQHGLTFRSLEDVMAVKARLDLLAQLPSSVSVTVLGAGASGVELATKTADRLGSAAQIRLVDRGPQVLKPFPKGLQRQAMRSLMRRGVELHLNTQVDEVGEAHITLNGKRLANNLTLWATGTEPVVWPGSPLPTNDFGQVSVRPTLQLEDHDNVFVLGDGANQPQPTPNTAQAAYQAAAAVAGSLANLVQGKRPKQFRYLHLGDMLTLGQGEGGVWSFGLSLGGKLGGIIRRVVYLYRMPTNHHRFKVARRAWQQLKHALWG